MIQDYLLNLSQIIIVWGFCNTNTNAKHYECNEYHTNWWGYVKHAECNYVRNTAKIHSQFPAKRFG